MRALHLAGAGGSTATRLLATAQSLSLWMCTPTTARRRRRPRRRPLLDERRQRRAVGVAQADDRRARLGGGAHAAQGVVARRRGRRRRSARRRRRPRLPCATQEAHRVVDHAQVLVAAHAQHLAEVQAPGLADDGDRPREGIGQHAQVVVGVGRRRPCARVMPKATSSRVRQPLALHAPEELRSPWGWTPESRPR